MDDTKIVSEASHPRRATFDLFSMWALMGALLVSAVIFIPLVSIPFVFTKVTVLALGILIALAAYILARLTRGNIVVPPLTLLGAVWLVPLAYLLSSFFSGGGAAKGLLGTEIEPDTFAFMLLMGVIAALAALTFRRTSQYRTFFKVGAILAAIVFATEIIFIILGLTMPAKYSATANVVGTFTDLGMFAGLAVIITLLSLRFVYVQDRTRNILWVITIAGLAVLAVVNSTLLWILVGLTGFGLFVEAILRRKGLPLDDDLDGVEVISENTLRSDSGNFHGAGLAPSLVTLVFAIFFLIGGQTIGSSLTNSLGAGYLDVRPSWQSTFLVGSHSYASSPLFGSGPGTFGQQWLKYRDQSINDTIFWNIDFNSGIGFVPTSFITTGIVGALAWIVFLSLFMFYGIRTLLFRTPEESFARFATMASFIGATYVFLLAIFSVPGPVILSIGFLLTGICVSTHRYAGGRREWGLIFSRNPRLGFVIVFTLTIILLASVVSAYVVVERYLGSVAYAEAAAALANGNVPKAESALAKSLIFSPSDRNYQLAVSVGIAQMQVIAGNQALSPAEAQQKFQAALSQTIAYAKQAVALDQNNYKNWMALGNVYQIVVPLKIDGAYANAKQAYAQAEALNPSSPSIPYVVAQLDVAQVDLPSAEKDLIAAITLKRDYPEAIYLLSQVQVQEGKAKEALQTAEAAAYFAPNDPNILFQVGILRSGTGDQTGAATALAHAVNVNPQFANARFFLAVVLAGQGNLSEALKQLNAVAALGPDNAKAVAGYITTLTAGKNPFPQTAQGALGVPEPAVTNQSANSAKNQAKP
jgi:tetratricopeptide (TPR) repeat protein